MPNKPWLITAILSWLAIVTIVVATLMLHGCASTHEGPEYITGEAVYEFLMAGSVPESEK